MRQSIHIDTPDGTIRAHVARPATAPAPVVVVLHEVFGVNADMRQGCDELAGLEYLAICPDLLWRLEPGVDISDRTQAELDKALALYTAFNVDTGVDDAARVIAVARDLPSSTGKVGLLGFCLGGLMIEIRMGAIEVTLTRADATLSWTDGNYRGQAAMPYGDFRRYVAEGAIALDQPAHPTIPKAVQIQVSSSEDLA